MVWSFNIHGRKVSHKTNDSQTVFVSYCTLKLLKNFSFCTYSSQDVRQGPSKVIDVTVQVKDSRLSLTESSKVRKPSRGKVYAKRHGFDCFWLVEKVTRYD